MLFNSEVFVFIFLPITLLGFFLLGSRGRQRAAVGWLVFASVVFYGWFKSEYLLLLAALSGNRVAPGPAGSPHRGRSDVLPTGRNLFAVDPRAVPTRAAHAQGIRLAEELLRRHLQSAVMRPHSGQRRPWPVE